MRHKLLAIGGLTLLLLALDRLFRVLHPHVDLVRASLVGLSALAALAPLALLRHRPFQAWAGALAIFTSAFVSVLLIEANVLVSRSALSGAIHMGILAAVFTVVERIQQLLQTARSRRPVTSGGGRAAATPAGPANCA